MLSFHFTYQNFFDSLLGGFEKNEDLWLNLKNPPDPPLKKRGALETDDLRSAVLVLKSSSKIIPDYWMAKIDKWVVYPWEHRESIISLVKAFRGEQPAITLDEIRNKLVFEVGFDPTTVDYFITRL